MSAEHDGLLNAVQQSQDLLFGPEQRDASADVLQ